MEISRTLAYSASISCAARLSGALRFYLPAIICYVGATYFTDAFFMGDTVHYSNLIINAMAPNFGHLLWLLSGSLIWHVIDSVTKGLNDRGTLIAALIAINWVSGLICVVVLYDLSLRLSQQVWVGFLVTTIFVFSQTFLNFVHTGCSYIPGLAFFLAGLWLVFRQEATGVYNFACAIGSGIAFTISIGLWFPYVLAVPGALGSTLLLFGWHARRLRWVLCAFLVWAITAAVFYSFAAMAQGIYDPYGFIVWMSESSHGITSGGFARMVFGFPRSFINMANDGVLYKRFLLHDAYNPVSLFDLMRVSLGKFLLFYLLLMLSLGALVRSRQGRRFFAFLVVSGFPVIVFAWFWQGGDMERYLPLYPALFLSFTCLLSETARRVRVRHTVAVLALLLIFVNGTALSKAAAESRQTAAILRLGEIQLIWKPHSRIATVLTLDDLNAFYWNYPFNPINLTGILSQPRGEVPIVFDILNRNGPDAPRWREMFAAQTIAVWRRGGDMWVSKEAFSPRPSFDFGWVEGDDPRVSWHDVHQFFLTLETGQSVGGENGFFLLPPTQHNRERLAAFSFKEG
ncbi:MAG TPA: hypothetical protein VL754_22210 [Verrucomicrobiae bacterium]|jgi:hypothetical protein|nr:hypothetical protein [Verrucomicrobiae bacterium]